jgi:hypothetical protein
LLATVSLVACFIILNLISGNFREVATKIAPSIVAAQTMGQTIEEMDAYAADYQLTSRIDVTSPDLNQAVYGATGFRNLSWQEYQTRLRAFDNALLTARNKAQYEGEAEAINRIVNRFYDYTARIELMKYELDRGRKEVALANYKEAQDILVGNLGNAERDANGNSAEKLLKDRNWTASDFVCAVNCATGSQGTSKRISFDAKANYEGISANIHKLSEINQERLSRLGSVNFLESIVVAVAAITITLMVIVVSVYYALLTKRILNFGFLLAGITAIAFSYILIANLDTNIKDYQSFSEQYVPGVRLSTAILQLGAGANADLSRLLLSPDSPGLDSTNAALTSEVKQSFSANNLKNAYEVKKQQVEKELANLWRLANTSAERNALCEVITTTSARCSGNTFNWTLFSENAATIISNYDRKLLAAAIAVQINPKAATDNPSAREPYNNFSSAVSAFAQDNRQNLDARECRAIGTTEFGSRCGESGYLNWLQILIWVAYPLIVLMFAGGVFIASRQF